MDNHTCYIKIENKKGVPEFRQYLLPYDILAAEKQFEELKLKIGYKATLLDTDGNFVKQKEGTEKLILKEMIFSINCSPFCGF